MLLCTPQRYLLHRGGPLAALVHSRKQVCACPQLIALHDVTSTEAAIIYSLEPVLGALGAYLLLGERWGPAGWIGAALIVASSLAVQIFGEEKQQKSTDNKQNTG